MPDNIRDNAGPQPVDGRLVETGGQSMTGPYSLHALLRFRRRMGFNDRRCGTKDPLMVTLEFYQLCADGIITFMWFRYVVAVEQVPRRTQAAGSSLSPCRSYLSIRNGRYRTSSVADKPTVLLVTMFYSLFQVPIPIIYIIGLLFFVLRNYPLKKVLMRKRVTM